jgi:hypothetical protein
MADTTTEQFLATIDAEEQIADRTSSLLNLAAILMKLAILAITCAASLAVAKELWTTTLRAILAFLPGLFAGVLALLNPRVDWHRRKEIELRAIAHAVRYGGLSLREASGRYIDLRRLLEGEWQKTHNASQHTTTSK